MKKSGKVKHRLIRRTRKDLFITDYVIGQNILDWLKRRGATVRDLARETELDESNLRVILNHGIYERKRYLKATALARIAFALDVYTDTLLKPRKQ